MPHINGTITTGNTAQVALSARPRQAILIQSFGGDLWINFNTTAAANVGLKVSTTIPVLLRYVDFPEIAGAMSIVGATTGWAFAILES